MNTILNKIVETKHGEIEALKAHRKEITLKALERPVAPSFYKALAADPAPRLIAEIKKASPSKGIIREDFHPVKLALAFENGGAHALSVLTDAHYFQGNLSFLEDISRAVTLPILRKDFILHELQILEAKAAGASAVLLIASILDPQQLADLYQFARSLHLQVLLEVHDETDVEKLAESNCQPRIVGINNRDLKTFDVDLTNTKKLALKLPYIPDVLVAESGIHTNDDIKKLQIVGARAFLVGESLMREDDVEQATRQLLGIG
jgi:indole-3-glycerol phosphate synthase